MRPAWDMGLRTALIRRGPWGHLLANHADVAKADFRLDSLTELPLYLAHDDSKESLRLSV
jgi:hypothetical protein